MRAELNSITTRIFLSKHRSAVTLSSGEVLITGGGFFNDVFLFSPKDCKIEVKASMKLIKKEHSSVYMNGKVYAIGGYDGPKAKFLKECEVYDVSKDEWDMIAPMNVAKCAFAASKLSDHEIFVCGGFDGENRVNSMEIYDSIKNTWTLLEDTLPARLSNSACCSINDFEAVILGGGTDYGFSKDVYCFDLNTRQIKVITQMQTGRDLRNKVVFQNNQLFCIGVEI